MTLEKIFVTLIASLSQVIATTIIMTKLIKNLNKKRVTLFFFLAWIYFIVGFLFIPNSIRLFVFVIVISLLVNFILNLRSRNSVIYAVICIILLSISELVISLVLVLFNYNSANSGNNSIFNILINVLVSILSIIIIKIPIINKIFNKIISFFSNNKKYIYYLYSLLVILYLLVAKNGLEFVLKSSYYVNILFLILSIGIITLVIKKELKSEQLQEINSQMLSYVTKYEKIIAEQGKANHEFKNQLMVIKGYAQMNNSDRLIEYLDSITEDARKSQSSHMISQLNKFPDGGIKGLLYYKLSTMEDMKINYDINVENGIKRKLSSFSTNMYKNITKILGVLLDNAIDASSKSNDKKILIFAKKDNDRIIFSIQNTYFGKVDLEKLGTGYTTKGKGRGYGLRLVNDIISSNTDFIIKRYIERNYYITDLIINIKNKK